jgi:hypothetical protein
VFDKTSNQWKYILQRGNNPSCSSDHSWLIGAYFSHSYNTWTPEFNSTDKIESNSPFYGKQSTSGIFGLSASKWVFSSFHFSGKLNFITNDFNLISVDTNKKFVKDSESDFFIPYQTGTNIHLKNFSLGVDLGLDWKFTDYLHLSGGINCLLNVSKRADIYENLFFPPGFVYPDNSSSKKKIQSELPSLSTLNLGFYFGAGASCNVWYKLQVIGEVHYYWHPFSHLSDADLFMNRWYIKFGIRYAI